MCDKSENCLNFYRILPLIDFYTTQSIVWDFVLERAPHFGGLYEALVRNLKEHLHCIVGNAKLTFEELMTLLTQIQDCLNCRPLTALPGDEDGGIQVVTPGYF